MTPRPFSLASIRPSAWKGDSPNFCIVAVLWCQKRLVAPVLRIEVNIASCGTVYIFIIVNRVGAFISVSSATATVLVVETRGKVHEDW